jgi:putative aldouronate transport system permease protein
MMVLPGLLFFLIFHYAPMLGLVIAFKDYKGMGGISGLFNSPWVGFQHFINLFSSHSFYRLLRNTFIISLLKLVWGFPAPIILALVLNEIRNNKFKRIIQTTTYLPHFISWVVVSGLVMIFLSANGPVNHIIKNIFHMKSVPFLSSIKFFRSILVVSDIWKEAGWGSIIYLAAIASIPQEQYESAHIEGAKRFQMMRYITIPAISFVISIMLIMRVGRLIDENFEQIFNLYNPTVYEVSDVFETYIYRVGIGKGLFSYSTAIGLFKSIISLILVVTANKTIKLLGEEGLW